MNMEETVAALLSENEQLGQENDHLKTMLSLVKENRDLRARMQSFNSDSLEEFTGIVGDFLCHEMAARVQFRVFRKIATDSKNRSVKIVIMVNCVTKS